MKRVEANSLIEYEVSVNFGGYVGADNIYTVYANDEEEAEDLAIEDAKSDLNFLDIVETDDGEWEVTIGFCDFIGVEETYQVYADDENSAFDAAVADAEWDLTAEVIDSAEEDEEDEEEY